MNRARALLPVIHLMPAVRSRKPPDATPRGVDVLKRLSGRTLQLPACRAHPIDHHVAGPLSVDPDKAGRRRAPRPPRAVTSMTNTGRSAMT